MSTSRNHSYNGRLKMQCSNKKCLFERVITTDNLFQCKRCKKIIRMSGDDIIEEKITKEGNITKILSSSRCQLLKTDSLGIFQCNNCSKIIGPIYNQEKLILEPDKIYSSCKSETFQTGSSN